MNREEMSHDIIYKLPYIFKRFMAGAKPPTNAGKQTFALLHAVEDESGKPMSYYSEFLTMPKSNLSVAANSLIEDGLIERTPSEEDRRVICLNITDKGRKYIGDCMRERIEAVSAQLSILSDEDLQELHRHILGIIRILTKAREQENANQQEEHFSGTGEKIKND